MAFHPYLYFDGNCREAFTRYQEIFGGELIIMSGTDAPPEAEIPTDKQDLVMHASLMHGDELLMASDSYEDTPAGMAGMYVHYTTDDIDRAKAVFAGLAEDGVTRMEGPQFWTPYFAVCTDRFGTPWQISVDQAPGESG